MMKIERVGKLDSADIGGENVGDAAGSVVVSIVPPPCVACRHYSYSRCFDEHTYACLREVRKVRFYDPVHGWTYEKRGRSLLCEEERRTPRRGLIRRLLSLPVADVCGPDGRYFEDRSAPVPPNQGSGGRHD